MKAIKGTNENIQCRGFQYELDKIYKMDEEPILCEQGFHACLNPYEVLRYYENNGKNRYFLVDLGGTITDCDGYDTKVAANEITFLKEVSVKDFPALFEEFIQDKERLAKLLYIYGFAQVRKGDKWNLIDKDGNYLCKEWFDFVCNFSDWVAKVMKNGQWNFIDKDGNYLFKEWFDEAYSFSDGFAKVKKDHKWNLIDKEGNYLCKEWFDYVWYFIEGFSIVEKGDKYNLIDKEGKLLFKEWFDDADSFYEGFARVKKGNKYNFIDHEGEFVSEDWFDYAWFFFDGFAMVMKDDKMFRLYPDGHLEKI